jgi:hypothetical protein
MQWNNTISYDLNVFLVPQNLRMSTEILTFEFIVTELQAQRGFGGHLGRHLKKKYFRELDFPRLLVC